MNSEWIIQPAELKDCLSQVILVDVREPEEYAISYIPGGHLIPLGELSFRAESELKKNETIVIYCAHGVRSLYGVMALQKLGFSQVRSLEGGIVAWEEIGGSVQTPS